MKLVHVATVLALPLLVLAVEAAGYLFLPREGDFIAIVAMSVFSMAVAALALRYLRRLVPALLCASAASGLLGYATMSCLYWFRVSVSHDLPPELLYYWYGAARVFVFIVAFEAAAFVLALSLSLKRP